MLIVEVKNGNIEKSLKNLKGKIIRTKQNAILFDRKEFVKPSVKIREGKKKAVYIQKLKSNKD
jgi:ribosomal protein S21